MQLFCKKKFQKL